MKSRKPQKSDLYRVAVWDNRTNSIVAVGERLPLERAEARVAQIGQRLEAVMLCPNHPLNRPTADEIDTMERLASGATVKQIAGGQGRSVSSVEKALRRLRQKFACATNAGLVALAVGAGLVS